MRHSPSSVLLISIASLLFVRALPAQQDTAPVDTTQLLQSLKLLRDTQTTQVKATRIKALQGVQTAAVNGTAAAALWVDSVGIVQFSGAAKDAAQFKDWKEKAGDVFKEKPAQSAARLYFSWLAITLQRSGGVTVKELLPQIVQFTKDIGADQLAMDAFIEQLKHDKERAGKHPSIKESAKEDEAAQRMHDDILKKPLAGSVPVLALKINEFVAPLNWEGTPGNVDGIFTNIILPELRAQRDPRVLEYWDMKVLRETETANQATLTFEKERFFQVRRPELLWKKAQDELVIGQKTKSINDMFLLIKSYPAHPSLAEWITRLEEVLVPPAPTPASASSPAGGAPLPTGAAPAGK